MLTQTPSKILIDLEEAQEELPTEDKDNSWMLENYSSVSGAIAHSACWRDLDTMFTKDDDNKNYIVYSYIDEPRLVDIEKRIREYEKKYKMKSEDFYRLWKNNSGMDNEDFNDWNSLYQYLLYAQAN